MQSDMRFNKVIEATEDEYLDEDGNLICRYDIEDDTYLATPLSQVQIVGRTGSDGRGSQAQSTRRRRPANSGRCCSNCSQVGHNVRTCPTLRNHVVPEVPKEAVAVERHTIHVEPSSVQGVSQLVTQGAPVAPSVENGVPE